MNHACINTKLSAMRSQMLKEKDFEYLMNAKDLTEIFDYLNTHTYYETFFKGLDGSHLHRAELEVPLLRERIYEIEKIVHYLQGTEKQMVLQLLARHEVESLRLLIRGIAGDDDLLNIEQHLIYSEKYTKIPFEKLLKAGSWDDFKELLKGTDYYRILEIYSTLSLEEDLFAVEKSIERYYYDEVNKTVEKLDHKKNSDLIEIIQKENDILNLIWFYRGKKFYHLSREELLAYAFQGGLKIKESNIRKLGEIKSMEAFHEMMKNFSEYAFLFNHTKTLDLYMERRRERYFYYMYLEMYQKNKGLGKVVAFLRLTRFEIDDIKSIIESKRYRMTVEETKKYLIRSFD